MLSGLMLLALYLKNSLGSDDMSWKIPLFRSKATSMHLAAVRSRRVGCRPHPAEMSDRHRALVDTLPGPTDDPNSEQLESANDSSNLAADGNINSYDTVPAVMMAIASTVIVCAAVLYINDLRDRCRQQSTHGTWCCYNSPDDALAPNNRPAQSWMRRLLRRTTKCFSNTMEQNGSFPKPPPCSSHDDDWECVEKISLSPVSTITASFVMDHGASNINHCHSDLDLAESKDIKTLTDLDRVPGGIDLSNLVDLSQMNVLARYADLDHRSHDTSVMNRSDTKSRESVQNAFPSVPMDANNMVAAMSDTEEDESGWTSVDGKSHESSDASIGSYTKSAHSGRSLSSSMRSMALFSASSIALRRTESRDERLEVSTERSRNGLQLDQRQYPTADHREGLGTIAERNSTLLEYWLERNHLPIQESKGKDSSDNGSTEIDDSLGSDDSLNMASTSTTPPMTRSSTPRIELHDHVLASGYTKGLQRDIRMRYGKGDGILKNIGVAGETSPINLSSHAALRDAFAESEISSTVEV